MLQRRRGIFLDILLLVIVAGVVFIFLSRIKSGFHYTWHWSAMPRYFFKEINGTLRPNVIVLGFLTTIRLSFWVSLFALLIGTLGGILGSGKILFFRLILRTYVEFIRNTPPLVLIFIFYFFIGSQILNFFQVDAWVRTVPTGIRGVIVFLFSKPERLSEFLSAVLTLGLYEGAYVSELVRGGLMSIPVGQFEAAHALGLSTVDTYRFVILPQVFKNILPSLTGQVISAVKDSSIVSIISIQELTFQGMELMAATYYIFEVWITITALYFILTFSLSRLASRFERKHVL